jgi:hypothetical protein
MEKPFKIAVLGFLFLTLSSMWEAGTKISDACQCSTIMNDQKTPLLAKELFVNADSISSEPDEVLSWFTFLNSKDREKSIFYFKAITHSYKFVDGAFAEGLGNLGKTYIEHNTRNFARFFEETNCFTNKDLETWADIALLEFKILCEDEEDRYIFKDYLRKINSKCKGCSSAQINTLNRFRVLLQSKWDDYLIQIDN